MKTISILIIFLSLIGCAAVGPEKATSIDDYCSAVAMEADKYMAAKTDGMTQDDQKFLILRSYSNQYPPKEIHAMLKVLSWVYNGQTLPVIKTKCIEQRQSGIWFDEPKK